MTPSVLPLFVHPSTDPAAWRTAADAGRQLTVVVNVADGPGDGHDPAYTAVISQLAAAGVPMLGYVDAGYTTRPITDLLDDVGRWARYPVGGVWLDHSPTSPFNIGPVALAARVARRCGLDTVVLNPGVPTDPLYREIGAVVCTFEGSWRDYRRWSGDGSHPGDLHLVHSVPVDELATARALMRQRGVGGLVTDLPGYAGMPAWLPAMAARSARTAACEDRSREPGSPMPMPMPMPMAVTG